MAEHPTWERAHEMGEEKMIEDNVEIIRGILSRHRWWSAEDVAAFSSKNMAADEALILDIVGYFTGMLRPDGTPRGARRPRSA